jgi:hypothetical protein
VEVANEAAFYGPNWQCQLPPDVQGFRHARWWPSARTSA